MCTTLKSKTQIKRPTQGPGLELNFSPKNRSSKSLWFPHFLCIRKSVCLLFIIHYYIHHLSAWSVSDDSNKYIFPSLEKCFIHFSPSEYFVIELFGSQFTVLGNVFVV